MTEKRADGHEPRSKRKSGLAYKVGIGGGGNRYYIGNK
jgi:hypothetical protein